MRSVLLVLILSVVTLAGCTDDNTVQDGAVEGAVSEDEFQLEVGKGAIEGLLVDDRFRPIDLEEDPETEFQATGFILLQETGQQVKTDENGQFAFVDLEPGTYTLRTTADGHEAVPQRVTVEEGLFAEAQLIARRVSSEEDVILTVEFSAFAPCFTNFVVLSVTVDCTQDRSGDTDRGAWYPNMEPYNGSLEYIVLEGLFNNEAPPSAAYDLVAREGAIGTDFTAGLLQSGDGRYLKLHLPIGEISPDPPISGGGCDASPVSPDDFCPYTTDKQLQIIIFGRGYFYQEIKDAYAPANDGVTTVAPCSTVPVPSCLHEATMRRGAGGALGTQATYMLSLFLFDPEADGTLLHETDYCVICPPSD